MKNRGVRFVDSIILNFDFLFFPQNSPTACRGDECGMREGGRGNGSFPVEESRAKPVENREVLKIKARSPKYPASSAAGIGRADFYFFN